MRLFLMLAAAALLLTGGLVGILRGFGQYRGRVGLGFPLIIAGACLVVALITLGILRMMMSGGL